LVEIINWLKDRFVIVDLGSANASDLALGDATRCATLVELDAGGKSRTNPARYHKHFRVQTAVSGTQGKRVFFRRKFSECSSILEPNATHVRDYGLDHGFALQEAVELDCDTLVGVLTSIGVRSVDFLKTDLEGLDYEILVSGRSVLTGTLVIQSELRFQPFYVGEPPFHTVAGYLADLGFELITLRPEVWKYNTSGRDLARDGRLVWADAIFFLRPDRVHYLFKDMAPLAFAKQVLLAKALDLHNYAEHILEDLSPQINPPVARELRELLRIPFGRRITFTLINLLSSIPGAGRVFAKVRQALRVLIRALTVDRRVKQLGSL